MARMTRQSRPFHARVRVGGSLLKALVLPATYSDRSSELATVLVKVQTGQEFWGGYRLRVDADSIFTHQGDWVRWD